MSSTNGYPFLSKRAVAERIRTDRAFAVEAFKILLSRTEQRAAGAQGSSGFMASHGLVVRKLAAALEAREPDDAEHAKLVEILAHYAKQLAAHFRAAELQARPELLAVASTFSAIPAVTSEAAMAAAGRDEVTAIVTESSAVDAPARRRSGRPKGSKNRPKEEQGPKRRRRRS